MSCQPNKKAPFGWKSLASVAVLLLLVVLAVGLIWQANCQAGPSIVAQLRLVSGNSPTVGKEESDFYRQLAQQKINGQGDALPLQEEAANCASHIYAQFLIGERLDLCSPFSYEQLKQELERENQERARKKQAGEPLEGPEQFDLAGYLQYRMELLRAQIVERLAENPNETLLQNSRTYWEQNQGKFAVVNEVSYEVTLENETVTRTLKREQLAQLKQTNPTLWGILVNGKEGQLFEYQDGEEKKTGKILSLRRETATFEEAKDSIVAAYLQEAEYPRLVALVAKNNPVQLTQE